jgi:2-oxoisovalerate dehydrogenase E1 component alpha subunit
MEELSRLNNPILRFRRYLEEKRWWDQEQEDAWLNQVKQSVLNSVVTAEKRKKPSLDHLFTDVYDEMPSNLIQQRQELARLIKEYPEYHSTDSFAPSSHYP